MNKIFYFPIAKQPAETICWQRFYRRSKKAHLTLSDELNEIIIGTMLGDLTAEKPKLNSNTRLQFKQSLKNKLYIEHLYSLFQEFCGTSPVIMSKFDSRPGKFKEYSAIKFQTLSLPCFNKYRELFYNLEGKKIIPYNLDEILTERGLAYWIMDDGYKAGNGFYICTESYSIKEHKILIDIFKNKFNLNSNAHKTTNGYRIYIFSNSKERLYQLIKPYLLTHFNYKFVGDA